MAVQIILLAACLLAALISPAAWAQFAPGALPAVHLMVDEPNAVLGTRASVLVETEGPLTLRQAVAAAAAGRFTASKNQILNFGLGAPPAWIHLTVRNDSPRTLPRLIAIENAWVDQIDVHVIDPNGDTSYRRMGDSLAWAERGVRSRYFHRAHDFPPGVTDIYIRAQSRDPMVLPLFIFTADVAAERAQAQGYSYGFLYGYLLALLAYNAILFLGLRDKRQFSYVAFLGTFVILNLAYTGHAYAWFWPEQVTLQRWIIPCLMMLYTLSGLLFASQFLDMKSTLPRTRRFLFGACIGFVIAFIAAALIGPDQYAALLIAFIFIHLFAMVMPLLGLLAYNSGFAFSRYFLAATLASMLGIFITAACALGLLEFSEWRFRAAELGMLIDATLLALAMGSQLRSMRAGKKAAEDQASRDPLTELRNRRSFMEEAQGLWARAQRDEGPLSAVMLDLDYFKNINDTHGHAAGDAALIAAARVLSAAVRDRDLVARWGGEEFLILLPGIDPGSAVALAERLRRAIGEIRLNHGGEKLRFTASIGVAHKGEHDGLERLISEADHYLYQSKKRGRNCVSHDGQMQTVIQMN